MQCGFSCPPPSTRSEGNFCVSQPVTDDGHSARAAACVCESQAPAPGLERRRNEALAAEESATMCDRAATESSTRRCLDQTRPRKGVCLSQRVTRHGGSYPAGTATFSDTKRNYYPNNKT